MAHQIVWLPKAEEHFEELITYLQKNWSDKEIESFVNQTEKVLSFISQHPRLYRSSKKKDIHEALITKHNLLLYKVLSTHIELLTFFDTRQNPRK